MWRSQGSSISVGLLLAVGACAGVVISSGRPAPLHAGGGDHPDAPLALTVSIATEQTADKIGITNDAVCYLNYPRATLLAAIPMLTQTAGKSQVLSDFAERDLLRDFPIPPGTAAHFTMVTGKLGARSEGWAPLYVFESTTGQFAAYRIVSLVRPGSSAPQIQLVEKRTDPRFAGVRRTTTANP